MKESLTYLIFKGDCKNAMNFYKDCLDGEILSMTTFGESPIEVKEEYKHLIFDSELRAEKVIIKASDSLPENNTVVGTNFSLFLTFSERNEQEEVFDKLSSGGEVNMPLEGPFGMLTDKFRVQWMLVFNP